VRYRTDPSPVVRGSPPRAIACVPQACSGQEPVNAMLEDGYSSDSPPFFTNRRHP
jgi:hypothetical protein